MNPVVWREKRAHTTGYIPFTPSACKNGQTRPRALCPLLTLEVKEFLTC